MSKAKPLAEMARPNRRYGDVLRSLLGCPWCQMRPTDDGGSGQYVSVVAYRTNTVRLCCERCGLRFSINSAQLDERLNDWTPDENGRPPFRTALAHAIWTRDAEEEDRA